MESDPCAATVLVISLYHTRGLVRKLGSYYFTIPHERTRAVTGFLLFPVLPRESIQL